MRIIIILFREFLDTPSAPQGGFIAGLRADLSGTGDFFDSV
jgi:hypothetical protein